MSFPVEDVVARKAYSAQVGPPHETSTSAQVGVGVLLGVHDRGAAAGRRRPAETAQEDDDHGSGRRLQPAREGVDEKRTSAVEQLALEFVASTEATEVAAETPCGTMTSAAARTARSNTVAVRFFPVLTLR